jgi:PhoH-like ATPase
MDEEEFEMKKIFVLDTNVLLHDPHSIFAFQDNDVVIPAVVLEEMDTKKRLADEVGRNARYVSRLLDDLRQKGHLHDGVTLDHGGILKVELNHRCYTRTQELFGEMTNDNRILAVALNYQLEEEEKRSNKKRYKPVVLVSKDTLVRIKADVMGITAEDYLTDHIVETDDMYTGYATIHVHPGLIDDFYSYRSLPIQSVST